MEGCDFDDADEGFSINWDLLKQKGDHQSNIEQEEEQEQTDEFIFSTFRIGDQSITIREQPRLGIAHQVWKAVRSPFFFSFFKNRKKYFFKKIFP